MLIQVIGILFDSIVLILDSPSLELSNILFTDFGRIVG